MQVEKTKSNANNLLCSLFPQKRILIAEIREGEKGSL